MAKYLVETYYNCSFKVSHYLEEVSNEELQNLEKRDDGKFEILDVKLDKRKTKSLDQKNKIQKKDENIQKLDSLKDQVTEALSDVINLTSKLTNTKKNLPDKLPNNPMELSFWIGAHLGGPVAEEQQRLL